MSFWSALGLSRPRALRCPAQVRMYGLDARRRYSGDDPSLTLDCKKPLGHTGKHEGKAMEWEVAVP